MNKNFWESNHIVLRALEETDLQMYLEKRKKPDSIREFYEDKLFPPLSEKEIRDHYNKAVEDFSKEDKRIFIIESKTGEYMGEISVWETSQRARFLRYGIFLEDNARGKGFGKEALIIVLDYYFNELNYRKASPMVYSYNINSQKFHEKFGFKLEGRSKEEIYTRGNYHDLLYYGLFKDEFNSLYGNVLWKLESRH